MICPVGSLQPDVIATQPQDPPGTVDYTCQSAQNWLNAPSTTTACADGRAYWRTTCCTLITRKFVAPTITLTSTLTMTTTTATLTMTNATATLTMTNTTATLTTTTTLCLICPNEGFRRNAVANQPQDPPGTSVYTCISAQDWLNAPSTTVTCASGQAFWNTTCCIPRPSQAPSPAPSPAPSRAPSPAPVDHVPHREPVDVERVRSEIRSFIRSSNLNEVKLNDLLQHLEPLFVGPINATSRRAIEIYAAELADMKIKNAKKNR